MGWTRVVGNPPSLLPTENYERLLEDLQDLAAIAERRDEPAVSQRRRDGSLVNAPFWWLAYRDMKKKFVLTGRYLFGIISASVCVAGSVSAQIHVVILPEEDDQTPELFQIAWATEPGSRYQVERSEDLVNWFVIEGFPVKAGAALLKMPFAIEDTNVFFRVSHMDDEAPGYTAPGFVRIPPGSFSMGSLPGELGRDGDETQHRVTISRAFSMQTTEVTWSQWNDVTSWALQNGYPDLWHGRNGFNGDGDGMHPVTDVTWYDALKWLNAWSERDKRIPCYRVGMTVFRFAGQSKVTCDWSASGYRLPSEAEWEYACRANTTASFYGGENTNPNFNCNPVTALDPIAWYCGNNGNNTHPVGQKQPNDWGLYDMSGNVLEWCWDWLGGYGGREATDPRGSGSGEYRVFRGGGFSNSAPFCRSAKRHYGVPEYRYFDLGFRPVSSSAP